MWAATFVIFSSVPAPVVAASRKRERPQLVSHKRREGGEEEEAIRAREPGGEGAVWTRFDVLQQPRAIGGAIAHPGRWMYATSGAARVVLLHEGDEQLIELVGDKLGAVMG